MAPKRKKAEGGNGADEPKSTRAKAAKEESVEEPTKAKSAKAKSRAPTKEKAGGKKSKAEDSKPTAKKRSKKESDSTEAKDESKVEPVTNPKETPEGVSRDSRGRLVFEGHPEFRPTLTPKQVIQAGSFGGIYFNPLGGKKSGLFPKGVPISADDFPKDWFEGLRDEQYKGTRYNIQLNRYKVKSGQTQSQWEEQGWIKKDSIDKRGWFQWYCHFTLGRRSDDDKRQISRWTGVAGPKGRWKTRLVNLVKDKGGAVDDRSISPVVRQNLLHWAYELTQQDYEAMAKGQR